MGIAFASTRVLKIYCRQFPLRTPLWLSDHLLPSLRWMFFLSSPSSLVSYPTSCPLHGCSIQVLAAAPLSVSLPCTRSSPSPRGSPASHSSSAGQIRGLVRLVVQLGSCRCLSYTKPRYPQGRGPGRQQIHHRGSSLRKKLLRGRRCQGGSRGWSEQCMVWGRCCRCQVLQGSCWILKRWRGRWSAQRRDSRNEGWVKSGRTPVMISLWTDIHLLI